MEAEISDVPVSCRAEPAPDLMRDLAPMNSGPWIAGQARNDSHLKPTLLQFPYRLIGTNVNYLVQNLQDAHDVNNFRTTP